jgi:hypothetical protein
VLNSVDSVLPGVGGSPVVGGSAGEPQAKSRRRTATVAATDDLCTHMSSIERKKCSNRFCSCFAAATLHDGAGFAAVRKQTHGLRATNLISALPWRAGHQQEQLP